MTRQERRREAKEAKERQERRREAKGRYELLERFVREKGGILFLIHRELTTMNNDNDNEQLVTAVRDDYRDSAVFDFNIGNGAGLSMLFECEKALSDQIMSIECFHEDVIWFGGSLNETDFKYISSTYDDPSRSAPVPQKELVDRVNQTIDRCLVYMAELVREVKMVNVNASNRMNAYICNSKLGAFIQEKYPGLMTEKEK